MNNIESSAIADAMNKKQVLKKSDIKGLEEKIDLLLKRIDKLEGILSEEKKKKKP